MEVTNRKRLLHFCWIWWLIKTPKSMLALKEVLSSVDSTCEREDGCKTKETRNNLCFSGG